MIFLKIHNIFKKNIKKLFSYYSYWYIINLTGCTITYAN